MERRKKEKSDDDDDDEFDKECDRALEEARRKAATASLCEFLYFVSFEQNILKLFHFQLLLFDLILFVL